MSDYPDQPMCPNCVTPWKCNGPHELPAQSRMPLDKADWTPQEALQFYCAGRHFDVVDGRTRILDTGDVASSALKRLDAERLVPKGDAKLFELELALSNAQAELDKQRHLTAQAENLAAKYKAERDASRNDPTCEHCGSTRIYFGPPDCPHCGAPVCCQTCREIDALKAECERLRRDKTDGARANQELMKRVFEAEAREREAYKVAGRICIKESIPHERLGETSRALVEAGLKIFAAGHALGERREG